MSHTTASQRWSQIAYLVRLSVATVCTTPFLAPVIRWLYTIPPRSPPPPPPHTPPPKTPHNTAAGDFRPQHLRDRAGNRLRLAEPTPAAPDPLSRRSNQEVRAPGVARPALSGRAAGILRAGGEGRPTGELVVGSGVPAVVPDNFVPAGQHSPSSPGPRVEVQGARVQPRRVGGRQ